MNSKDEKPETPTPPDPHLRRLDDIHETLLRIEAVLGAQEQRAADAEARAAVEKERRAVEDGEEALRRRLQSPRPRPHHRFPIRM